MGAMATDPLHDFIALCGGDWVRLQLTQAPGPGGAERLQLRPLPLRGEPHWQAVWRHPTKDITENWPAAEGPARIAALLSEGWRSAALWTTAAHWQLDRRPKGGWRLVKHRGAQATVAPVVGHNRDKP